MITDAQTHLPVQSGLLFANPIPTPFSIPRIELQAIINRALDLADQAGAGGSANTPFVLRAIKDLSQGKSVIANRALVEANVIRGTRVANELSRLERETLSYNN